MHRILQPKASFHSTKLVFDAICLATIKIIIWKKCTVLHHIDQFLEILKMHFTHQIFINTIAGGVLETTVSNSFKHLCNLCVSTSFSTIFLEANAHLKCALRITYPILQRTRGLGQLRLIEVTAPKHIDMVIQWKLQNEYVHSWKLMVWYPKWWSGKGGLL